MHTLRQVLSLIVFCMGQNALAAHNIFIVLTDDQRFDTLWAMPVVQSRLVQNGVNFTNSYVSTPQCCPARSGILSGGFLAQNTGVLTVNQPNGGFQNFDHNNTIATQLATAGYKNAMIGKYFALFDNSFVPPGWQYFVHTQTQDTNILTGHALQFLDQHDTSNPFMLYFSTSTPHHPAIPAPAYTGSFSDYLYRGRGYGESDLSDKPSWVANNPQTYQSVYFSSIAEQDEFHRDQLRTLLGIDQAIDSILEKINAIGELNNTVIIFTSDNGYMWGEHGQFSKNKPYEESVRVPLVVVYPGVPARTDNSLIVMNTDLGATIHDIANVSHPSDGSSLIPLLIDPADQWRTEILIEEYRNGTFSSAWSNLPWSGIIRKTEGAYIKYVEYAGGGSELYDLANDPYELDNKTFYHTYAPIKNDLINSLNQVQGLAITSSRGNGYPNGLVGAPFQYQLTAWGGDGNYSWSIDSGTLPPGANLNASTGMISGTPTSPGSYTVFVAVEDTATADHTGVPQRVVQEYIFNVSDQDSDGDGLLDSVELGIGTNPHLTDTDGDNLTDGFEVGFDGNYSTYTANHDLNPLAADTDGDGFDDDMEIIVESNPLQANSIPIIGDINDDGQINVTDVLLVIKFIMGTATPSQKESLLGDAAPLINNQSNPDGNINAGDLFVILRMALGQLH